VSDAVQRFEETGGNKNRAGSGRKRTATDEAHRQQVEEAIRVSPSTKVFSLFTIT
jgi:transposase